MRVIHNQAVVRALADLWVAAGARTAPGAEDSRTRVVLTGSRMTNEEAVGVVQCIVHAPVESILTDAATGWSNVIKIVAWPVGQGHQGDQLLSYRVEPAGGNDVARKLRAPSAARFARQRVEHGNVHAAEVAPAKRFCGNGRENISTRAHAYALIVEKAE